MGIKLASEVENGKGKGKFVVQIVGDGTFLFSVPGSVYWICQRYNIPVLTIVLNNKGMYPSASSNSEYSISLTNIYIYSKVGTHQSDLSFWFIQMVCFPSPPLSPLFQTSSNHPPPQESDPKPQTKISIFPSHPKFQITRE